MTQHSVHVRHFETNKHTITYLQHNHRPTVLSNAVLWEPPHNKKTEQYHAL